MNPILIKIVIYAAIGVAGLLSLAGIRQHYINKGHEIAMAKCEAAALKLKLEAVAVDLSVAQRVASEAEAARDASAAEAEIEKQKAAMYADELKKRPNGACTLTDDDVRWLLDRTGRGAGGASTPTRK
jgi:hypothetical protein